VKLPTCIESSVGLDAPQVENLRSVGDVVVCTVERGSAVPLTGSESGSPIA
jgi:hypothetical protein